MVDDKASLPERFAAPDSHPMISAPELYPVAGHKSVRRGRERHSLIFRQHLSGYVHKQSREENSRDESTAEPEPAHLLLLLAGSQRPLGGFGSGQHF